MGAVGVVVDPSEYRMPRRRLNVYVVPPPVGAGMVVARSGTSAEPAAPPTRAYVSRPSFVLVRMPYVRGS
jgi:hypothetical protein